MGQLSTIRLEDGQAKLAVGERIFAVSRRDAGGNTGMCPVDMIVGALGS